MFSLTLLIQPGFRELFIKDKALTVKIERVLYLCVLMYVIHVYSCGSDEWVMSLHFWLINTEWDGLMQLFIFTITLEIHKEKSNKMQHYIKIFIIPYLYEAQPVSGDTPPIIRSLKLHGQPLVFHT
jgi:hypothetical protein